MAKRVPTQIVLAAFHEEKAAEAVAEVVLDAAVEEDHLVCTNLAIVTKSKEGKTKVKELGKVTKLQGAAAGGVSGGLVGGIIGGACGLFFGPAGIAAGAAYGAAVGGGGGAVIGGTGAAMVESMEQAKLDKLGSVIGPGNSALVVVLDEVLVKKSDYEKMTEIKETRDAIFEQMGLKINETLKKNEDIAYLLAVAEDGILASRMIVGAEAADIKTFLLSPEVIAAGQATVTEEGVVGGGVAAVADGIVGGRALINDEAIVYEAIAADDTEAVEKAGFIVPTDDGGVKVIEATATATAE